MISTDELLEQMDELLDSATAVPLRPGKVIVSADELRKLIDDIRLHLPQEIRQARAIVAERNDIVADARRDAESITRKAEERARALINKEDILRRAQIAATETKAQAQTQAREIKKASTEYAEDIMRSAEDALSQYLMQIRQSRQNLRTSMQNEGMRPLGIDTDDDDTPPQE